MSRTIDRSLLFLLAGGLLAAPGLAAAQSEPTVPAPTAAPGTPGTPDSPGTPADGAAPDGPPAAGGPPVREGVSFGITTAAAYRFDTELDGGAEYDVTSFVIEPEITWNASRTTSWTFSASYALDQYDFSGTGGLGGLDPWDDVSHLSFTALARTRINDDWTFFGGPSIRFAAETGANLDDGLSVGGFAGAGYRVNDRLTIGPGFGIFSEIEGDVDVFPVLIVNWRIRDDLTLRTGGGTGATRGPGLELAWTLDDELEFGLGFRYGSDRFRLDDAGFAPDGVGESEGFGIVAAVRWQPSDSVEITAYGGVRFGGQLRIEDQDGNELLEEDVDPQPLIGLNASFRF
jgi:hypothetical protein